jgi:Flp pilus assembly protein TadG
MHMRFFKVISRMRLTGLRKRSRKSGSVMVMFTIMMPFVLVPFVGLAIDATMLYSVKAKLQTAVDGGAIAAAQTLKSGLTFDVQKATAEKTADQFIRANFVTGYWGSHDLKDGSADCNGGPCVVAAQDNTNKRRTVSVTASVTVPLLFMRILGFSNGTVAATGTAARRDVVLVLALDRSSSIGSSLPAVQAGATYFVSQFQPGRDRVGLVVFGGSAIVAYPPGDWNTLLPTGPDTDFMTANPSITTLISQIKVFSNTGTAEALMLAYQELKAANQPGALNVIVLFTDGLPNGISANFNPVGSTAIKSSSTCAYKDDGGNPARSMIGWIAQGQGYKAGGTADSNGIQKRMQSSGTSVSAWLGSGNEPVLDHSSGQPGYNCAYAANTAQVASDLNQIPALDLYQNSTSGMYDPPYTKTDYTQSKIWSDTTACNNGHRQPYNPNATGDACQIGLASWNAADMAAKQIRKDNTLLPVIYCMGYEATGGTDPALMQRLANVNVASNTVYDKTKPQGMYIQIFTPNDIMPAFQSVLAEILRLTS